MLRQVGQSIYTWVGGKSKTFLDINFIPVRMWQRCLALQCGLALRCMLSLPTALSSHHVNAFKSNKIYYLTLVKL